MSGIGPRGRNTYSSGAPSAYVAGVGRGAVGFTTRSDIGPAGPTGVDAVTGLPAAGGGRGIGRGAGGPPPGYVAGCGRGMGGTIIEDMAPAGRGSGTAGLGGFGRDVDANEDYGDYSESNYDQFAGYSSRGGLFNDTPYDKDDEEADDVFANIDERMDSRRKRRREQKALEDMKKARQVRPKISDQFADLKSQLGKISDAEWDAIPDIGDYSLKYKASQQKAEKFTPMPDHMIDSARQVGSTVNTVETGANTPVSGTVTGLAEARGTVLSLKLDKMSDSVSGQTVVDPKGYLTDLNSLKITSDAEIGDIKKARLLLRSVTTTNPKHGPGWIAAARLEEVAGKLVEARRIIAQGCSSCPENEDVWLEAARLRNPQDAKTVLANAVRHVKTSVKVWMHAADLEESEELKKRVLRKALEFIPNSVKLWKAVIELEDPDNARIMLGRAVECVPQSMDLWLALARLETYENAKKILNKARAHIPTEPAIWINAAKLEEAHGNVDSVDRIIQAAVKSLASKNVLIDRESWLSEAEACEKAESPLTCAAIVRCCIGMSVEEEDRKRTWMDDAENAISRGAVQTARAIYAHALKEFPSKKSIWLRAASLEKDAGSYESLEQLLQKAVAYCPQEEILWLMAAKEVWNHGSVDGARMILRQAFGANPNNEKIWLAAVKLEWENDEFERARALLAKSRSQAPSPRIWIKSILLECELKEVKREEELIKEGISLYPDNDKLYMMAGQYYITHEQFDIARKYFKTGLQHCPKSIPLWTLCSALEERVAGPTKARSVLELARLKNPKTPELWLAAARLEGRAENIKGQETLMAKGLQECPESGILLAEAITIAPRAQQRSKSLVALKKCDNDPHVCLAVARLFWKERKYSKARKWFERTVTLEPDMGDSWAYYYKFELEQGTAIQQTDVMNRCVAAEPRHGEKWCQISKNIEYRRSKFDRLLRLTVASL